MARLGAFEDSVRPAAPFHEGPRGSLSPNARADSVVALNGGPEREFTLGLNAIGDLQRTHVNHV